MPTIAYFSMEIALNNDIKSYAGGLGILAGDTLKSAADLGLNMVGITLLYKYGYFKQEIDPHTGAQIESNDPWNYQEILELLPQKASLQIEGRTVMVQVWKYEIQGINGHIVPVYFLDTDIDDNYPEDRYTCFSLYTKYEHTRIRQEILLGAGGVLAMEAIGYETFDNYHLNESHAAFAVLPLQEKLTDKTKVKSRLVFTTHTPILHGHRGYPISIYKQYLPTKWFQLLDTKLIKQEQILLTDICLDYSKYTNGVAQRHGEVSRKMFPGHTIDHITNGVHTRTWLSEPLAKLCDQYIPDWQQDPELLRNALRIPDNDIYNAHQTNKVNLLNYINQTTGEKFDTKVFTIGFARRVDGYKRPDFILSDLSRLEQIATKFGGLQLVFAGKAYPDTQSMENIIAKIYKLSKNSQSKIKVAFLPNYNMDIASKMVAGSDIWLNNPVKPLEASGTSGMKAALNGVPNFSVLDGWWPEGWIERETGWAIGQGVNSQSDEATELNELYSKLENDILPTFFHDTQKWLEIQKQAIALNGSYFHTHRMVGEYLEKGYLKE